MVRCTNGHDGMTGYPVGRPDLNGKEVEYVLEALRENAISSLGRHVAEFERAFAAFHQTPSAVAVSSGTAALHLALHALGVGPGDEVIVPDVTWIASVAPVVYVGATPALVDILPDTWCIDPDAVLAAIGPKTKAIIGVDLYGSTCEWERLEEIAARHGLGLIEDAAEALGSARAGKRAGAFGHASAFSFHGSKTVATGEGGMLATDDAALHERVLRLRDHGRAPGDRFFQNDEIAFKYRMSAVTAALGVAQMERIDALIERKRAIFGWYAERLGGMNGLCMNVEPPGTENSYWMVSVAPDASFGLDKFALMDAFSQRNIDTRPFFSQLSTLPAFDERPESKRFVGPNDKGAHVAKYGINLPSGYTIDEAAADLVSRALKEILGAA